MRKALSALVVLAGAALCAACQTGQPQQAVGVMESGLTALERAAVGYVSLPRCPQATVVCSDPAIVQKIRDADNAAYTEIKKVEALAAQGQSPDMTAASAALQAFQDLLATPTVSSALKAGSI